MPNREALALQPRGEFRNVCGVSSEAVGELLRRQPAMEVRRGRVLLIGQQSLQSALLLRCLL